MSPSFQSLATRAKSHHEAVNAAYTTYYGITPSPTPRPSLESQDSQKSTASQTSTSSTSKAWKSVKKAAKEHHQSINAAVETYYGVAPRPSQQASAVSSQRSSMESVRGEEEVQKFVVSEKTSTWSKVKKAAKEHHRGMNAAYQAYYGIGMSNGNRK
jgi:hypothetical protein